jgi:hypothetical protein
MSKSIFNLALSSFAGGALLWFLTVNGSIHNLRLYTEIKVGDDPNLIPLIELSRQLDRDTQSLRPINSEFSWSARNYAELLSKLAMLSIIVSTVPILKGVVNIFLFAITNDSKQKKLTQVKSEDLLAEKASLLRRVEPAKKSSRIKTGLQKRSDS